MRLCKSSPFCQPITLLNFAFARTNSPIKYVPKKMSLKRKLNYNHSSLGFFRRLIIVSIFVMMTNFAVSLKNVHQRTTKILPFDFNGYFPNFPTWLKCSSQHAITAKY